MLEEVGVQAAFGDLHVGLYVVGEDLDLQLDALFGQGRFDELEEFRVRHGGGRDTDLASVCGGGGEGRSGGQGSQQFLHVQLLVGYGAGSDGWPVARCSRCGEIVYLREKWMTSLSPTICSTCTRTSRRMTVTAITSGW